MTGNSTPNWGQSFRMLYWWLKAKLEAVAYGLSTVEQEFLSQVITSLPDGRTMTVGEALSNVVMSGQLALEAKTTEPGIRMLDVGESKE